MGAMNGTIGSHQSPPGKLPATLWIGGFLGAMTLGLAVVLWHLASSPGQLGAAGRHSFARTWHGRDSTAIGDLVRWRGSDGVERLLVANGQRDAIVVYAAATGEPLAMTVGGRFEDISGLALRGNRLFVIDLGRRRVQALSLPDLHTCPLADDGGTGLACRQPLRLIGQ